MSLTVSNVFNQTQTAKTVTNQKANQEKIGPIFWGVVALIGLALGASSCSKDHTTDPINVNNNVDVDIDLTELHKITVDLGIQNQESNADYQAAKQSFSENTDKLGEFAQWHIGACPDKALKPQDYTPARAAYFVATDEQAKAWYDAHFLNLVG